MGGNFCFPIGFGNSPIGYMLLCLVPRSCPKDRIVSHFSGNYRPVTREFPSGMMTVTVIKVGLIATES